MEKETADPAILKARELFAASGKTLEEVGLAMGFAQPVARKSVWQLLNKVDDVKVSTLRKLAAALEISVVDFFDEKARNQHGRRSGRRMGDGGLDQGR